jgi:hypothetical protein
MLKIRFGLVPETEVKMPHPFAQVEQPGSTMSVLNGAQYGKMV